MVNNLALPLRLFGFAFVNADGTFQQHSGNLTMLKGSAGNYILQPSVHIPGDRAMPVAISSQGIPFLPSCTYGLGPTSDGIQVIVYNASPTPAVTADGAFYFYLYTAGDTDYSVTP